MKYLLSHRPTWRAVLLCVALLPGLFPPPATAQLQPAGSEASNPEPVTLTLTEAVQIALINNYALQNNRLDLENASAQVREAWGRALPQVDASASYTRNLKTANPFAGSEAGNIFSGLGFLDWLSFNERARTDDDPVSVPITFDEFLERQQAGLEDAGIVRSSGDNPFAVANQFSSGITITQTLFDGSVFVGIAGAEQFKEVSERALERQEQIVVNDVRQAYYQALLAQEQAQVMQQSVQRTRTTLNEVARQVAQGVAPKFQRLSAEVELANQETQLVQLQNQASTALDNLKFTLGMPVNQPVRLRGTLEVDNFDPYMAVSVQDAFASALNRRADLKRARLGIELQGLNRRNTKSEFLPKLSAFANFNYTGSVPDNRTITLSDPNDPFSFSSRTNDFFSSSYWNPSINVGLRLTWNLFNGFQSKARVQQQTVALKRAKLDLTQLTQSVRLEVEQALRDLETAQQRILSQERNVERAELNYRHANARLHEGVATQLEEREASEQLDQSRLNYLQAVHDYLVARSAYETAVGLPLTDHTDLRLTSN